jgi:PLP dependent protein
MLMTDSELRSELSTRLNHVRERIRAACGRAQRDPASVTLVAVTKTVSNRVAALLPELGVIDFGENRPQELLRKAAAIPGVRWHFIGHLQRNKLDKTMPLVHLMHSADSERLLQALSDFGVKQNQKLPTLLEVNCSREEAKGGFAPETMSTIKLDLPGLDVRGLMTMAAYTADPETCRKTFRELRTLRDQFLPGGVLSMGMSNDFEVAIEEGADYVRIGSTLFEGMENL